MLTYKPSLSIAFFTESCHSKDGAISRTTGLSAVTNITKVVHDKLSAKLLGLDELVFQPWHGAIQYVFSREVWTTSFTGWTDFL